MGRRRVSLRPASPISAGLSSAAPLPSQRRAITLVELLVVLAIVGLIIGMSVPAFSSYSQKLRLNTTARQAVGLLALARSMAISSHAEHAVEVDADAGEIRVVNQASGEALEKVVRLPKAVTVTLAIGGETAAESRIVFRPNGGLGGRSVSMTLADARDERTITVTGTTGAVSLQ